MPRECTVCSHDAAHEINVALVQPGATNRGIARQYDLDDDAVRRHRAKHIPELLLKASQAVEVARADELLDRVEDLWTEAIAVLEAAKGDDEGGDRDLRLVLSAIDRASKQLELLARLRGELSEQPVVNIALVEPPGYKQLEDIIARALEPYGAARYAVAEALRELGE